jgi:hypothetical protein
MNTRRCREDLAASSLSLYFVDEARRYSLCINKATISPERGAAGAGSAVPGPATPSDDIIPHDITEFQGKKVQKEGNIFERE